MKRLLLLLVLTFVAACGPAENRAQPPGGDNDPLTGKMFRSVAVAEDGKARPLVTDDPIELRFGTDGTIEYGAACNSFGVPMTIGEDRLRPGAGSQRKTAAYCNEALTAQNAWLNAFFRAGPAWRLDGDDLVLTTERVEIRWEQRPASPVAGTP